MDKVDFKRVHPDLYKASAKDFALVDVPDMQFVMVDGDGNPNTAPSYKQAIEWLFSISYAMKFAAKDLLKKDYVVPPLEGLWWADDPTDFVTRRKDRWRWTMMIMAPDFLSHDMFSAAIEKTEKKLLNPPNSLRMEKYREGHSLQILHIGSYDDEGAMLARLHNHVMPSQDFTFNGKHHEIYLSDARKTLATKLRTILRQPVRSS
jgi:hypothetical protein